MDRDERISRFLKGKMEAREEAAFIEAMATDPELRGEAVVRARLVKGMRQVEEELLDSLKEASATEVEAAVRPRKRGMIRRPMVWMSIAASVALLMYGGYKGYDYHRVTRLGVEYATEHSLDFDADYSFAPTRGETGEYAVKVELRSLFGDVKARRNLRVATDRLAQLWEIANSDTYNDYTDYAPYIGWYLAVGYLEDYRKADAKAVLTRLAASPENQPNHLIENVEGLLEELK